MEKLIFKNKILLLIILTVVFVLALCVAQVSYADQAQSEEGMSFTADDVYYTVKPFEEAPNTFEAWVKLPTSTSVASTIIGNKGIGESVVNFGVYANGRVYLHRVSAQGVVTEYEFAQTNARTNEWIHIALVRDTQNGTVDCYFDGQLKQSLGLGKGTEDIIPNYAMYIGGDSRDGNTNYFKGNIKEIAVYSDARSAEEIAQDYLAMGEGDNLMAHYQMSQSTQCCDFEDISPNGYDVKYAQVWVDSQTVPFEYAYSFMVVGDTQTLNWKYKDKLSAMYDWIVDNIESKKVKMVIGLGDITETDASSEWSFASTQIHKLDGKVAYSIIRGNHDTISGFNSAFPLSYYADVVEGSYDKTMLATYQTMTIGQTKYLFLTLDYGANDAMLSWASSVCEKYSDHHVIVSTHAYMYRDNTTLDQNNSCPPATNGGYNNGDDIWNKFVKKHKNITLVLSGHVAFDRVIATQVQGDNGNVVTQILIDPQNSDSVYGGLGIVSTFYFSEDGSQVFVDYYSVDRNKYFRSDNQFSLTLDMSDLAGETQSQVLQSNVKASPQSDTNASDHSTATANANLLLYSTALDGQESSVWQYIAIPVIGVALAVLLTLTTLAIVKRKSQM